MALYGAWQTERFAREEMLKPLRHYLDRNRPSGAPPRPQTSAERLAVFRTLAASGVPIKIERTA